MMRFIKERSPTPPLTQNAIAQSSTSQNAIAQSSTTQNAIAQPSSSQKRDHPIPPHKNAIAQSPTKKYNTIAPITHQPEANNINKFDNNYCYLLLLQREY